MSQPTALNFITCAYGVKGSWMAGYHTGVDYRAPVGTKIHSTRRGVVVHEGYGGSYGEAYGKYIVIQSSHKGETRQHLYAHLSISFVNKGERVFAGQIIGLSGETGNCNGPHLHYEERVAPFNYWSHVRPVLNTWVPRRKRFAKKIFSKIFPKRK